MIIDTHCHYNLDPLYKEWQGYWQAAKQADVVGSVVVGTSQESSSIAIELVEQQPAFLAAVGIHPNQYQLTSSLEDSLRTFHAALPVVKQLSGHQRVAAIGECGLDYFRLPNDHTTNLRKELQKSILLDQLKLAKKVQLPLIIHLRDKNEAAYWDFLALYKAEGPFTKPFVLHCLSGPEMFVKECLSLGAYVGIAGNITYKNSDHLRRLVSIVPTNRLLVETDAPFLPPNQFRGHICEPRMIQWTDEFLQATYKLSDQQLVENTVALFPQFKDVAYAAI